MALSQRLALLLCDESDEGISAVNQCIQEHVEQCPFSPAKELLPFLHQDCNEAPRFAADDTLVIFYAVQGAFRSHHDPSDGSPSRSRNASDIGKSRLGILSEKTRSDHNTFVSMSKPMRYVVACNRQLLNPSWSPDYSPFRVRGEAAAANPTQQRGLDLVRIDTMPNRSASSGKRGMAILTRNSAALQRAKDIVATVERGTRVDAEAALSDCCTWLYESVVLIEEEFHEASTPSPSTADSGAFGLVDAVIRKHGGLAVIDDFINSSAGVFRKLETLVPPQSPAQQRWQQRKAHLHLITEQARIDAVWAQLLSTPLLTLRLTNCHRSQTLDNIAKVANQLSNALSLIFAAAPSGAEPPAAGFDGDSNSILARLNATNVSVITGEPSALVHAVAQQQRSNLLHFIRGAVIPAIGDDLLRKVNELLSLETTLNASPKEVADSAEVEGYVMPLATRDSHFNHFKESSDLLTQWTRTIERLASFMVPDGCEAKTESTYDAARSLALNLDDNDDLTLSGKRFTDLSETVMCSAPRYAAARCLDIAKLLRQAEDVGHGMLNAHVRTLFATMHKAANAFPLLSAEHYKNWQTFVHAFEKCLALKYEVVESVSYIQVHSTVSPSRQRSEASDNAVNNSIVDQSRSRVSTATQRRGQGTRNRSAAATYNHSVMNLSSVNVSLISQADGAPHDGDKDHTAVERSLMVDVAMLHEERAILSSRVSILTEELTECRGLLSQMQGQLTSAQKGMRSAEELNDVLLAEIRELKSKLIQVTAEHSHDEQRRATEKALTEGAAIVVPPPTKEELEAAAAEDNDMEALVDLSLALYDEDDVTSVSSDDSAYTPRGSDVESDEEERRNRRPSDWIENPVLRERIRRQRNGLEEKEEDKRESIMRQYDRVLLTVDKKEQRLFRAVSTRAVRTLAKKVHLAEAKEKRRLALVGREESNRAQRERHETSHFEKVARRFVRGCKKLGFTPPPPRELTEEEKAAFEKEYEERLSKGEKELNDAPPSEEPNARPTSAASVATNLSDEQPNSARDRERQQLIHDLVQQTLENAARNYEAQQAQSHSSTESM